MKINIIKPKIKTIPESSISPYQVLQQLSIYDVELVQLPTILDTPDFSRIYLGVCHFSLGGVFILLKLLYNATSYS